MYTYISMGPYAYTHIYVYRERGKVGLWVVKMYILSKLSHVYLSKNRHICLVLGVQMACKAFLGGRQYTPFT